MNKLLSLLFLLILPVLALSQSKEDNKLFKQGKKLYKAGKYEEAASCFLNCDSLGNAQLDPSSKISPTTKRYLLKLLFNMRMTGDMTLSSRNEQLRFQTMESEIFKIIYGEESSIYANSLEDIASTHFFIGNYTEAINLITMASEIKKQIDGEESDSYAFSLENLASYHFYNGNYTETIRLENKAVEILKKHEGEGDGSSGKFNYSNSLSKLSSYYAEMGNYKEAVRLLTLALEINANCYDRSMLATYFAHIGNYNEAIKHVTIAMECFKESKENYSNYRLLLEQLAHYYSKIGNFTEAIRLASMAMELSKQDNDESNQLLYSSEYLITIADYYYQAGNYSEAIKLVAKVLAIEEIKEQENWLYSYALLKMATFYFADKNYDNAVKYCIQGYDNNSSYIKETFKSADIILREGIWDRYSTFFSNTLADVAYTISENPTYCGSSICGDIIATAYNGQLFSKGLLLHAEHEFQKFIEQSGDTALVKRYYEHKEKRKRLDSFYLNHRSLSLDENNSELRYREEEYSLMESSQALGDYTKKLSIKWEEVQAKLKDNDVAIEFANFADTTKQTIYIALIVKKGMTSPELVKLDYSETDTVDYTTHSLYNKIWQPLEKYLQGVQNVYFSPTGKFHTIGIEYLPDDNGEIFAKKYSAYRLSSTREIALQHVANLNKKASVYGGIVYNFDESDWQNVSEDAERAGITFLKGAKKESEEITQILSDGSFDVQFGTDKEATEESFKKLSGSGIKILHIATHGFYEPEDKEKSFADMISVGDKNSKEDFSLSRSGLFLAGANTALDPEQRKYIPDGVDDGILTAKEISRMDFKGLDLVVLSACQTGLGEVTGEGVFGLQRGFKKAGAQTIVMSLWNVNDKPTKELMTEFYRNLVAGKTKREAFISAQDKIRLKYIDPKMWAGFIMVDGME